MPRIIEYIGEETEISDYLPEHYPENQTCEIVQGIFINPNLRPDFDYTPNEDRERLEIEHWYGRAYIVTEEYRSENYGEYVARTTRFDPVYKPESETEFNECNRRCKESWFTTYPSGVRYEVRCLTGGAWDRSSCQGMFASLELAVDKVEQGITLYGRL
ncbi:hypothetical protein WM008_20430 [Vibrio vulnificus]|uniref:hypothetical protein n=1 Tax=Vibrio vulnificus TaxID=672 RepID=UPI0030EE8C2D